MTFGLALLLFIAAGPYKSCARGEGEEEDVYNGIPGAAACVFESDHHTLRNVGQGHVVLEEGGEARQAAASAGTNFLNPGPFRYQC